MLIPKWHRELDLFSAIKPLLIMEGNITDQYRYPTDGSIRQDEIIPLNKYLHTYFCDQGYDQVVFYSNLRGFRNTGTFCRADGHRGQGRRDSGGIQGQRREHRAERYPAGNVPAAGRGCDRDGNGQPLYHDA